MSLKKGEYYSQQREKKHIRHKGRNCEVITSSGYIKNGNS